MKKFSPRTTTILHRSLLGVSLLLIVISLVLLAMGQSTNMVINWIVIVLIFCDILLTRAFGTRKQ